MWSLDAGGIINEDISQIKKNRATGLSEKASEVSRLQSLHTETESFSRPEHALPRQTSSGTSHKKHINSECYHANEAPMLESEQLNLYDLPLRHTADKYCDIYFNFTNFHFPIIRQSLFLSQYEKFYAQPYSRPGNRWLSVLNMIFAIASRYCMLVGKEIQDGTEDRVFFSRARMLSANENIIYSHPDLQLVQIEALIAFYLLVQSQVSR